MQILYCVYYATTKHGPRNYDSSFSSYNEAELYILAKHPTTYYWEEAELYILEKHPTTYYWEIEKVYV